MKIWQDKIHEIGTSIAAIDGFYKEYNKSLVCLRELQLNYNQEQLKYEYSQGVSAHPTHIRNNLDFKRNYWINEIQTVINNKGVVILKGVSGQGKSTLCYRYLIDTYPEGCVFCVRSIANEKQAQNLVAALDALGKHNEKIIIYIDVQPGETLWAFLLQELQSRGLTTPVLISIRDEDYNRTPISGKAIQYGIVELILSKEEAEKIIGKRFPKLKPILDVIRIGIFEQGKLITSAPDIFGLQITVFSEFECECKDGIIFNLFCSDEEWEWEKYILPKDFGIRPPLGTKYFNHAAPFPSGEKIVAKAKEKYLNMVNDGKNKCNNFCKDNK